MIFAYESPGMNALHWLQDKTVDPLIQNTFKPEALSLFDHINHIFEIPWTYMLCQVILIATIGICSYVAATSIDQKPIGNLIALVTIVSCLDAVVRCVIK